MTALIDHVPIRSARALAGALQLSGLDVRGIFAGVGIDVAQLFDPTVQMPYARWCALWRRAELESRDPLIGLRTGSGVDMAVFAGLVPANDHVLLHMVTACPTIEESLAKLAHYAPIGFGISAIAIERERGKLVVAYTPSSPAEPTSIADFVVGLVVGYLRSLAERPAHVSVELDHRVAPIEAYKRLLGVPVTRGAERTAVVMPARSGALKLKTANRELVASLLIRCEAELAARVPRGGFLAEVRTVIAAQIERGGADSVAEIAEALQTSRRTLSRRLAGEGTTFQVLLDDARTALANRLLAAGQTIAQVAHRLGFADASSFTRAFRRWTGKTPAATRRGTSRTP